MGHWMRWLAYAEAPRYVVYDAERDADVFLPGGLVTLLAAVPIVGRGGAGIGLRS